MWPCMLGKTSPQPLQLGFLKQQGTGTGVQMLRPYEWYGGQSSEVREPECFTCQQVTGQGSSWAPLGLLVSYKKVGPANRIKVLRNQNR